MSIWFKEISRKDLEGSSINMDKHLEIEFYDIEDMNKINFDKPLENMNSKQRETSFNRMIESIFNSLLC